MADDDTKQQIDTPAGEKGGDDVFVYATENAEILSERQEEADAQGANSDSDSDSDNDTGESPQAQQEAGAQEEDSGSDNPTTETPNNNPLRRLSTAAAEGVRIATDALRQGMENVADRAKEGLTSVQTQILKNQIKTLQESLADQEKNNTIDMINQRGSLEREIGQLKEELEKQNIHNKTVAENLKNIILSYNSFANDVSLRVTPASDAIEFNPKDANETSGLSDNLNEIKQALIADLEEKDTQSEIIGKYIQEVNEIVKKFELGNGLNINNADTVGAVQEKLTNIKAGLNDYISKKNEEEKRNKTFRNELIYSVNQMLENIEGLETITYEKDETVEDVFQKIEISLTQVSDEFKKLSEKNVALTDSTNTLQTYIKSIYEQFVHVVLEDERESDQDPSQQIERILKQIQSMKQIIGRGSEESIKTDTTHAQNIESKNIIIETLGKKVNEITKMVDPRFSGDPVGRTDTSDVVEKKLKTAVDNVQSEMDNSKKKNQQDADIIKKLVDYVNEITKYTQKEPSEITIADTDTEESVKEMLDPVLKSVENLKTRMTTANVAKEKAEQDLEKEKDTFRKFETDIKAINRDLSAVPLNFVALKHLFAELKNHTDKKYTHPINDFINTDFSVLGELNKRNAAVARAKLGSLTTEQLDTVLAAMKVCVPR